MGILNYFDIRLLDMTIFLFFSCLNNAAVNLRVIEC